MSAFQIDMEYTNCNTPTAKSFYNLKDFYLAPQRLMQISTVT